MKIAQPIIGFCLAMLLSACGGGSDSSPTTVASASTSASVLTGTFVDSPVSGIRYATATQSGKTNSKGEFLYVSGENVIFSIGSVQFPAVVASAIVTPLNIAKTSDLNDQVVSNILILLQSLDEDGNPTNGIVIPAAATAKATTAINFDVSPIAFAANSAVTSLVANSGSVTKTLVTQAKAKSHFQSTLRELTGAVIDDLTPAVGTAVNANTATLCGYGVGSKLITGKVTAVHDGDTITIDGLTKVRLDTIDAPELSQSFGGQSQLALSNMVLGGTVRVAYSKLDKYGRTVGSVFTAGCDYVNLRQVASGMAWFYKAYQCEAPAAVRGLFASAQDAAISARLGLWSEASPEAPWMFRNGVEPEVSICMDPSAGAPVVISTPVVNTPITAPVTAPVTTPVTTPVVIAPVTSNFKCADFSTQAAAQAAYNQGAKQLDGDGDGKACEIFNTPATTPVVIAPVTPPSSSGCYRVFVSGYYRSNGTYVNSYYRNSPGC